MEFRLLYEGPLKTNRGPVEKQVLRREFHGQLKELLTRPPMQPFKRLVDAKHQRATIAEIGGFTFIPLISERLSHVARLEITLLSPEEPGRVITQGGDLDNRVKTLLDALRMPKVKDEIPAEDAPKDGETPFYCLLEDDNLISGITVVGDRLLRTVADRSHVFLVIRVIPESTGSSIGQVKWTSI
jgi:hypothetical protein